MLVNYSNEALTVPKATVFGVTVEISESVVDKINAKNQTSSDIPAKPLRRENNEALYQKLLEGKLDNLPPKEKQLIEPVPKNTHTSFTTRK